MTIAFVQRVRETGSGSSSNSATFTTAVTAGNLLVADVLSQGACTGINMFTVADTIGGGSGNTRWTRAQSTFNVGGGSGSGTASTLERWYCWNSLGGTGTVTATFVPGSGGDIVVCVCEYSGVQNTSDPLNGTNANSNLLQANPFLSGAVTPTASGALLCGAYWDSFTGALTNSPFTGQTDPLFNAWCNSYYIQATAASIQASFNGSDGYQIANIAAFLPAGGGGSSPIEDTRAPALIVVPDLLVSGYRAAIDELAGSASSFALGDDGPPRLVILGEPTSAPPAPAVDEYPAFSDDGGAGGLFAVGDGTLVWVANPEDALGQVTATLDESGPPPTPPVDAPGPAPAPAIEDYPPQVHVADDATGPTPLVLDTPLAWAIPATDEIAPSAVATVDEGGPSPVAPSDATLVPFEAVTDEIGFTAATLGIDDEVRLSAFLVEQIPPPPPMPGVDLLPQSAASMVDDAASPAATPILDLSPVYLQPIDDLPQIIPLDDASGTVIAAGLDAPSVPAAQAVDEMVWVLDDASGSPLTIVASESALAVGGNSDELAPMAALDETGGGGLAPAYPDAIAAIRPVIADELNFPSGSIGVDESPPVLPTIPVDLPFVLQVPAPDELSSASPSAPSQLDLIVTSESIYVSGVGWTFAYPVGRSSLSNGQSTTIVWLYPTVAPMPIAELALSIDAGASWSGAIAWIAGQQGADMSSTTPVATFRQRPTDSPIVQISNAPSSFGQISFGTPIPDYPIVVPGPLPSESTTVIVTLYPIILALTAAATTALGSVSFCRWKLNVTYPDGTNPDFIHGPVAIKNV